MKAIKSGIIRAYWHEHTMKELAEIMPKLEVVIVPTGSTEIHGPHLGVGNDIMITSKICEEAAKLLYPRVLVCRALWLGVAPQNMITNMPGTVTLRAHTYQRVLYEVVESLLKHGVKRVVFVNGHGGNTENNWVACRWMREELHYQLGVDADIGAVSYWDVIPQEIWNSTLEYAAGRIGHGGEAETSLLMAVAPYAVRPDLMKEPHPKQTGYPRMKIRRAPYQDEYNPDGNTDDPRFAKKEKGEQLLAAAIKGLIEALEEFIKHKPSQKHQYPDPGNHYR